MEETESNYSNRVQISFYKKIRLIIDNITVEPIVLCYLMPGFIANIATQNLNLNKACRANLGYSDEICDRIANQDKKGIEEVEQQVQALVSRMNAWLPFIRNILPFLLLLFIGSISDTLRSRKPFILIPILGEFLATLGLIACTYFYYSWPMEIAGLMQNIFPALTGGQITFLMAIYSYIGDISTIENRTFRLGIISIVISLALPFGAAASGILYKLIGFYGVFGTAAVFYLIGFIYGLFRIKESRQAIVRDNKSLLLKEIFNLKHIVETFNVIFKKRNGNIRLRIILIIIIFLQMIGSKLGESDLWYMYFRLKFGWDEIDYSLYDTFLSVINFVGNSLVVGIFIKKLKMNDAILGAVGCTSFVIAYIFYATVKTTTAMYLSSFFELFNYCPELALRAISSKLVTSDELGTINSIFGICEAFVAMIYKPLYNYVYTNTLQIFPGTFSLLSSLIIFPNIILFLFQYVLEKKFQHSLSRT